jgi:Sulfotransferase family
VLAQNFMYRQEIMLTGDRSGCADPVFVLCAARTGSTLLRLLLNCHPELTCPAESNLPALCNNMVPLWALVTGNPGPVPRTYFDMSRLPGEVTTGLRESLDLIMAAQLNRSGKSRWCDKSLRSARYAELLLQVYPQARFLCLYRFPMDVVASALEACPYGLSGYGYESYAADSPGNVVLAVARSWLDSTSEIMSVEEDFGEHCLRLRYEDLVAGPQGAMDDVFGFLAIPPVEDIAEQCFSTEHERLGTADYKVWHTNRITGESVGRGWNIPPGLIAADVLDGINELSGRMGYIPIDAANWGIGPRPRDVRLMDAGHLAPAETGRQHPEIAETARLLEKTARAALASLAIGTPPSWSALSGDTIIMSVVPDSPYGDRCVHVVVNLTNCCIQTLESATVTSAETAGRRTLAGPPAVWRQILSGKVNLGVAMRSNLIRFSGSVPDWQTGELLVAMISDLLGLALWRSNSVETRSLTAAPVRT